MKLILAYCTRCDQGGASKDPNFGDKWANAHILTSKKRGFQHVVELIEIEVNERGALRELKSLS